MILGTPASRAPRARARHNPASVVKTARDKRLWKDAKAQAAYMGREGDWAYTMGIFMRMRDHEGGGYGPAFAPKARRKTRRNPVEDANKQAQRDIDTALKGTGLAVDKAGTSGEYADIQLSNGLIIAVCVKPAAKRKNPARKAAKKAKRKNLARKTAKKAKRK